VAPALLPALALGSALLLILAFPSFNQAWCAWVALVPWLVALRAWRPAEAFRWSWLTGVVFFLGSMWWMIVLRAFAGPMALVGWIVLCAYLALFFGLFGWGVVAAGGLTRQDHRPIGGRALPSWWGRWLFLLWVPALWVALEYARSHVLSGFGWNLLAYSQTPWVAMIQLADVTGAWGVSCVIVLVNVAIAEVVAAGMASRLREALLPVGCAAGVVGAVLAYGIWRMPQVAGAETARVAVVQGNIPQQQKWDEAFREPILERYETLTREAAAGHPQLIVWPETAVPGYLGLEEPLTQRLAHLAREVATPLLIGAPMARRQGPIWRATNSAALISPERGFTGQRYDKLRLVPFGEFVPFERSLPWLREVLPAIGDFVPGRAPTVFTLTTAAEVAAPSVTGARRPAPDPAVSPASSDPTPPFGALICFEDIFPDLARRFVREGARLLLVITNDAWFGPTAAAYQHAQASTFRAVELRVPVARAANTGWSGCMDPTGRWRERVQEAAGRELFVAGWQTCELTLGPAQSLYVAWGDWLALLCVAGAVGGIGLRWYNQRSAKGRS
jgi:apolipoprotein N-acyltransferase